MKKGIFISLILLFFLFFSCNKKNKITKNELSLFNKLEKVPDSIKVDDITVYNLFKHQILAHKNNTFDSSLIKEKVFKRQPKIWHDLYGVLFDKEMFTTSEGMIAWNKKIYHDKKDSIESRVNKLLNIKFDSVLKSNLKGLKELTGRSPKNVKLSIILAPIEGIGFGGMENDAFILDLLDNNFDIINMVQEGIPHEFNHFIYEPTREMDSNKDTPLRLIIDEGFACFYTYKYFDGKISKPQAVEQMTQKEWQWYVLHEKEVYQKCSSYFYYNGEDDPLRKLGLEMKSPKTLFYWLGFRIVESYTNKHGDNSWKDIYKLPVQDVLEKSGYAEYVNGL